MVYLIDPSTITKFKCPVKTCTVDCGGVIKPMYGIPPEEE